MTPTTAKDAVLDLVTRAPGTWGRHRHQWLLDERAKLTDHTDDELVTAALELLEDDDRNVRVKALWALRLFPDPRATEGVRRALGDPARRVREVAMKVLAPHHLGSPAVLAALRAITEDEGETERLRRTAFHELSAAATGQALPEVAGEALRDLMGSERFRRSILLRLCQSADQTPASRAVLHEFVRTGTKDEAVMATRALVGHVLVRVDAWLPPDVRQRVRETYDPAPAPAGVTAACWIPREDAFALAAEVYPAAP